MFRRGLIALVAAAALGIAGCSSNDGAFPLSGQRASVQPTTPAAASATVASTEPSPSPTAARPLPASEPDSGETLSATPPLTAEPQPATAVPAAQAPVQPAPSPRAEPDGAPQLPATRVLPALPGGWPSTFELGMGNKLGVAATMTATAQFGFRYKYLTGGAGTGAGWRFWEHSESDPPGAFVTKYLAESQREGLRSVFTYYMLRQARPDIASDLEALAAVTADPTAMRAYFDDLRLFFELAAASPGALTVLHFEPDLWGFFQRIAIGDDPSTVPVAVASSGMPSLAGLPDDAAGLAQAVVRLRDEFAPGVVLGYHVSRWATGQDMLFSDPSYAKVEQLSRRSATFYERLGASFDVTFSEFRDRDAGFLQIERGQDAAWWDDGDFARWEFFLATFVDATQLRVVLWQIPLGNTRVRTVNNTPYHYQDNKVERLLGDDPAVIRRYAAIGVIALLFGAGAGGNTTASDAAQDGVTSPAPINGNDLLPICLPGALVATGCTQRSADDDGGYFRWRAARYYEAGAVPLP